MEVLGKVHVLPSIKETTEDYEKAEAKILEVFRKEIYLPIIKLIGESSKTLKNENDALISALRSGSIQFSKGQFSGRMNAAISRELKGLGAKWDRRQGTFKIQVSSLPMDIRNAISMSEQKFLEKIAGIDKHLAEVLPAKLAEKVQLSRIFDTALFKVEKSFQKNIEKITVAPELTKSQRLEIAEKWNDNLKLYIEKFTKEETLRLRRQVQKSVYAGNRYDSLVGTIQKSYGVSVNKAKFLARQETSLLMAQFKETRAKSAGSKKYIWRCVHMPHQKKNQPYVKGDVRYHHGLLDGKEFSWDNPPIVNQNGDRKNPGQDYNCRCVARAVIRVEKP